MALAHRLTRPVEISAAGRKWRIVFTHRALLDIEELTGLEAMRVNLSKLSARLLRAVLFAALRESGSEVSLAECGGMLRPGAVDRIRHTLISAWAASFPDPEPAEGGDSPPPPPLSTLDAWAKARYDFHLYNDEWLAMTPRMLHAIALRDLERMRQSELMLGVLCAHTVNSSFRAPSTPTQARSYMLHPYPEEPEGPVYGETIMSVFAATKPKVN
jgi:hypothetical protein